MITGNIIGMVGNDATIKEDKKGKYTLFSIAHTEKKGETNNTIWISCFLRGEGMAQYIKKGKQIYVNGDLSFSIYENRVEVSCSVRQIQLLGKKE